VTHEFYLLTGFGSYAYTCIKSFFTMMKEKLGTFFWVSKKHVSTIVTLIFGDEMYQLCVGRALCLALAEKGVFVTVADFSEEKGQETTSLVRKANAKFHHGLNFPSAIFVKCDVTNRG